MTRALHPTSSLVTESLGAIHYNFYHRWSDVLFMGSAVATAVVLVLQHQSKSALEALVDRERDE